MLGEVLKAWRAQNELGFRSAAQVIGISAATLYRIENNKPMDDKTLQLVMGWLLGPGAK